MAAKSSNQLKSLELFNEGLYLATQNKFILKKYKGAIIKSPKYAVTDKGYSNFSKLFGLLEAGALLTKQSKYDEALERIDQAMKIDPHNVYGYCTKAFILGSKGEYSKSINLCRKALDINRHISEAWVILGNNYEMEAFNEETKGNLHKAEECHKLAEDAWREAKFINPSIKIPFIIY